MPENHCLQAGHRPKVGRGTQIDLKHHFVSRSKFYFFGVERCYCTWAEFLIGKSVHCGPAREKRHSEQSEEFCCAKTSAVRSEIQGRRDPALCSG